MVHYDLTHLIQDPTQAVLGPIQDDEALVLFALIRCMRLQRVFEIGGGAGYSANNFIKAGATLYTVDIVPVPCQGPNHKCIQKNALDITPEDLDGQTMDLIFFDCHDMVQLTIFEKLLEKGIITDKTVLALHDTNLHYSQVCHWAKPVDNGWAHQPVEREMVNIFKEKYGYDIFCFHTEPHHHDASLPFRHGLTICKKFQRLTQ